MWYYLVHDNFFVSGLDWGTIIFILSADFDEENKQTDNHIQFYEIIN